MYKSLTILIAAKRYSKYEAIERVNKACPKYITEQQKQTLLNIIKEVYDNE